jgi:autotransporter-associated beta strand protein
MKRKSLVAKIANPARAKFAIGLFASASVALSASAATEQWAGIPGVTASILWSDPGNWTAPQSTYYNQVQFTGSGTNLNTDFTVNNELDSATGPAQMPIWELDFVPLNGNYTTLIDPGVTLTLGAGRGWLLVGADQLDTSTPAAAGAVETITITGDQGAFSMVGTMWVGQGSPTPGDSHNVTLDMSGLANFTDNGPSGGANNEILVASGGAPRTDGSLFLAETNSIVLGNDFLVCNQTFSNSVPCVVLLGQQNSIQTGSGNLTIGGTGTTSAGASMKFNPLFLGSGAPPTATIGGTGSDGRVVNFWISDANGGPQVSGHAEVDFSGGSVSLLARTMQLGQAGNIGANATGTLSLDNGVVDVNDAFIGNQEVSGGGVAVGIVNLNTNSTYAGNATLSVNNTLTLGAVSGSLTTGTEGVINIDGGALQANNIVNGGGAAVIHSTNGSITITGVAGSEAAPLTSLDLVSSSLTLAFNRTDSSIVADSLTTGGAANTVNITSVPPSPSYPVQTTLIKYTGSIAGSGYNFAIGNLPPLCAGFVSNNIANGSIDLVLTAGPLTYTWTGINSGDWDTTTANWTAGGAVDYTDGAFVQFLDGAHTGNVNLTAALSPGGTTVSNNTQAFTFAGTGNLTGPGALNKTGSGRLVIDNSGVNNFTGGVFIDDGTLQIGNNDGNGSLPPGTVEDNGNLAFNRNDTPTFGHAITGSGSLTQAGAGSTLTLTGGNAFTGDVVVTNGSVLRLGGSSALGGGGTAIIANGSTLDANGYSATKTLVVSGDGFGGAGALTDSGGAIYDNPGPGLATNIVLAGDATFVFPTRWDLGSANRGSVLTASGPYNLTLNSSSGYFEWRNLSVLSPLADIDIAQGNLGVAGSTTFGDPTATLIIESGSQLTLYGANVYVNKGVDFQNGATIQNAYGANTMNGPMTLEAGFCTVSDSGGQTLILSNVLSGPGVFYQTGGSGGTTVLAGNSPAFTGGIQLYDGSIILNGSIGSGILAVSGTTLAGSGSASGLVDVAGSFFPGGSGTPGTFTAAGGLTLENGASITLDLGPNTASGNDLVAVTGDLTVNGNPIGINPLTGVLASGTYPLFTYTGNLVGSFGPASTVASSRYTFTVDTSVPHQVNLVVTGVADQLAWNNAANNGQWDVQSSFNWSNLTTHTEDQFFTSDEAIFDDSILNSAHPSTAITISDGVVVIPSVLTNNSTTNYSISGNGKISGGASIIKAGPSTLSIATMNDFGGPTTIKGGAIAISGQIQSGSSPLGTSAGTVFITNGSTLFLNLTGGYPNGDIGFGNKPIVVSGAGVDGNGAIQNNGNSIYNDSSTLLGLGQSVTLVGDTTIGGTARWDWGYPGLGATLSTGGKHYNFTIIQPGYSQWQDLAIDTNLANIDVISTATSRQTWNIQAMGASLGVSSNTLTLHSNILMHISHGDTAAGDNGYAKYIHVLDGAAFAYQPSGGAGDYRLATGFELENNAELDFFSGNGGTNTGTVISGFVYLNGLAHLQIGDSLVTFSNRIIGPGGFYWDNYNNTVAFAGTNTYLGITDIRSGRTLALIGNGSIYQSATISLAASATLDVSKRVDGILHLSPGQTLLGNGSVAGSLIAAAGSVLSPGDTNSIGTFTVTNAVTLGGAVIMELNASTASSDQLNCASIVYGGNLTLPNLAGNLAAGQSFQIFNFPPGQSSGSFSNIAPSIPGPGLIWDTSALSSGIIKVAAGTPPPSGLTIGNISVSGGNISFGGQYPAAANETFSILGTTNLDLPVTNWPIVATGSFDANGNFASTNSVGTNAQTFYLLKIP